MTNIKKIFAVVLLVAGWALLPVRAMADYFPTDDGGSVGIGLEAGDPGGWGIDGKIWVDQRNAFAPAVKLNNGGPAILQLDYLWHDFETIHVDEGAMPLYIGVGGDLILQSSVVVAARVPVGISYIFQRRHVPVDFFFQLVPTLWLYSSGATLDVYPEVGGHFYF
jgi:hypothetical protein